MPVERHAFVRVDRVSPARGRAYSALCLAKPLCLAKLSSAQSEQNEKGNQPCHPPKRRQPKPTTKPLDFYLEQGSDDFEVSVSVGDRVNDIATAREHNCTLLTHGGRVRCWGRGDQGRLGYGNDDDIGEQTTPLDYYKQQLGGNGDVQVF